ncbi:MAG: division/cell wall cluster transcriptional repressor MraZ, partial [Nitrospinota bacterium]
FDGCLVTYPFDEWQEVERKVRELPTGQRDVRTFIRLFYANAADCSVDRQGRILIPENLRKGAGLEKEVVMVGAGPKFEIWSRERWDRLADAAQDRLVDIAEASGIGL